MDFIASATDHQTSNVVTGHGYRGGPWVIDSTDAASAIPYIDAWQASYSDTIVHEATVAFSADVARYLVAAPKIAIFVDGNQSIARDYLQAAVIPDSMGDFNWPDSSPDMLDVSEVSGTDTDHSDGALFDADGDPVFCHFISMHWATKDAGDSPEVVAEVRQFLNHPTHLFAHCQSVISFENVTAYGFFLTPNGLNVESQPSSVDFHNHDRPVAQFDGTFGIDGGPKPAYSLPSGDLYKASDVTMITEAGSLEGTCDLWASGYLDGTCPPDAEDCGSIGKVSYLAGHSYDTTVPISTNPDTQGTRLFHGQHRIVYLSYSAAMLQN